MSTQAMNKDRSSESRQARLDGRVVTSLDTVKAIADYFKTQPVLKAWLFGSYSRGEQRPWSDVDILVQYDRSRPIGLMKIAGMKVDLEDLLHCEVDLVEEGTLRPWAVERVNKDRRLIYERTVHGYAQVSDIDLWQTATNDIHPLCEQVKHYLDEIDWDDWQQGEDPYTEIDNAAYMQAVESARRMKAKGYPVEDIAEITGLTAEEIEAL